MRDSAAFHPPRCGSANRVEGRRALGRQVCARPVDTDVGDRGAHLDRRAGRELHVSPAVRRRRAADAGIDRVAVPGAVGGERLAELHREIHRVGVVLAAESAAGRPPGDRRVVLADLDGRAGVARQRCAGAHVEQRGPTVARVLEPADAGAGGGGEFRGHSGGREPHGVVTGNAHARCRRGRSSPRRSRAAIRSRWWSAAWRCRRTPRSPPTRGSC